MMRTLGGLPRFLLGASSPVASAVEVPDFLFFEPLGRPLPRLAGVSGAPAVNPRATEGEGGTISRVSLGTEANRDTEWGTDRCWAWGQLLCLARGHRLWVRAGESQTLITDCGTRLGGRGGGEDKEGEEEGLEKRALFFLKKRASWEMI
jgi:hypothetical protein